MLPRGKACFSPFELAVVVSIAWTLWLPYAKWALRQQRAVGWCFERMNENLIVIALNLHYLLIR